MKLKLLIAFTIISRLAFSQINLEKEVVSREFIIHEFNSKSFKEKRVVKTFLPNGYNRKKKYPVIYVLDGDPLMKIVGDYTFHTSDYDIIPKSIVVGIFHKKRDYELNCSSDGNLTKGNIELKNFLFDEVIPLINETYSTSGFNTLIGHSNGATFSHLMFLQEQEVFTGFIGISENFFGDQLKAIKQKLSTHNKSNLYYFVASGKFDSEDRLESGRKLNTIFKKANNKSIKFEHKVYNAGHVDLVAKSLNDGLYHVFSDFKHLPFDEAIISTLAKKNITPLNYWDEHKSVINNIYGIEIDMNEDDFEFLTEIAIIAKNRVAYEQFSEAYDSMLIANDVEYHSIKAQNYEAMGLYEEALKYWRKQIEAGKTIDNVFYFERPFKNIYEKQHKPKEAIEFMEYAIEKYPKGRLVFNYYIAKVSAEKGIEKTKGERSMDYCLKNFEINRRFTLEDLKRLKQKLSK